MPSWTLIMSRCELRNCIDYLSHFHMSIWRGGPVELISYIVWSQLAKSTFSPLLAVSVNRRSSLHCITGWCKYRSAVCGVYFKFGRMWIGVYVAWWESRVTFCLGNGNGSGTDNQHRTKQCLIWICIIQYQWLHFFYIGCRISVSPSLYLSKPRK